MFLDLPALNLTPELFEDRDALGRHVAMSEAIARWYGRGGAGPFPSRNPNTYDPRQADIRTTLSHVRRFFTEVRMGDIVAVGGNFYSPIYFGEVLEPFNPRFTTQVPRYGTEQIHALRVLWHRSFKERRQLSPQLSRLLSNRRALLEINRQIFGPEVYSEAYGDYVVESVSRYIIEAPSYRNDGNQLLTPLQVISYFIAAYNALEEDVLDEFLKLNVSEAAKEFYESELLNALEVDFKSPGNFTIYARKAALPLFVAACQYSAIEGLDIDRARAANVTNSAAPNDTCTIEVNEKYKQLMRSMGLEKWEEVCRNARKAHDDVDLNTRINRPPRGGVR